MALVVSTEVDYGEAACNGTCESGQFGTLTKRKISGSAVFLHFSSIMSLEAAQKAAEEPTLRKKAIPMPIRQTHRILLKDQSWP